MSGLTGYIVGGQDLSGIFQPLVLTPALATNYKISSGLDLNLIFNPLGSGPQINYDTGFNVNNVNYTNTDLRLIFAAYVPFTTTGTSSYIYSGGYYTITFTGNGTINFTSLISNTAGILVVGGGGGGGGGGGFSGQPGNNGGAGGGGGGIGYLTTSVNINSYTINVGSGGFGGSGHNSGGPGTPSSFVEGVTNYLTATGGGAGMGIGNGITGGAGGTATGLAGFITYNGGNGGNTSSSGNNGNPTSPLMPINVYGTNYSFSGGGAGGVNTAPLLGGGAGFSGSGGIALASTTVNGITGVSYGSGGGGASGNSVTINSSGGVGAEGVVIIKFQYP